MILGAAIRGFLLCSQLLHGVLVTQSTVTGGGGAEGGESVVEMTSDMLARLPAPYDVLAVSIAYPVMYYNSMNTVLKQVRMSQF